MTVSDAVRERVYKFFDYRCAYCLGAQKYLMQRLEIDHIKSKAKGGTDDEENLCSSCRTCNAYKSIQTHGIDPDTEQITPLYNPRTDTWSDHFRWSEDGTRIIGLTATGRVTVNALQLNNEVSITTRTHWVSAGWHPPE
jgi:hypothetical protein